MLNICVVDDEDLIRMTLSDDLREMGFNVEEFASPKAALEKVKEKKYHVVFTDLRMPEMNGLEFLKLGRELDPSAAFVVITAYGTVDTAVEAMKAGAYDYVTKPFRTDEIRLLLERLRERYSLLEENIRLRTEVAAKTKLPTIIGKSKKMQDVLTLVQSVAPSDSNVLIYGETGTGKELIAEMIHALSPRAEQPLVKVSCAALTRELLESELFGHVKGAFTGATTNKVGRFELANNGTIFLDEVDDIPLELQVKLLRVLQEKEIERVGDSRPIKLDVRVIAATKVDLYQKVKEGTFRQDLYYRLHVVPITLPPLRERKEDIPLLINHFARVYRPEKPLTFTQQAIEYLMHQPWEGNVRELENLVERLSLICQCEPVSQACLPEALGPTSQSLVTSESKSLDQQVEEFERSRIKEAIQLAQGNKSKAAQLLGLPYSTLRSKMEKYGLE